MVVCNNDHVMLTGAQGEYAHCVDVQQPSEQHSPPRTQPVSV